MLDTGWKLTLKNAASAPARKITRDILALTSALNGLSSASSSAQAALSRVAPAGTAVQVRGATAAIREQTRALREQASVAGRARSGGGRTSGGARASALGGRTRLDVAAGPAGATRQEGASARDIAAGVAFQQRARALQASYSARTARESQRAAQANARTADRARRREESETARHYRNIYTTTQRNQRSLARLNEQAARRNERAAAQQQRARSRASHAQGTALLGVLGGAAGIVAGLGAAALGAATAFADIGFSAAQAGIRVMAFRESTLGALTAVTGSAADAGRTFQNAITVANQTPLDTTDTVAALTQLRVAGFSERDAAPLLAAFADISAARGNEAGQAFQRVAAQIRGLGRVNRGDIQQQALTAGLSPQDIYDSIARQMHLGTGSAGRQAAEARVGRRQVNSDVGLQAFLDATRQAYDNHGQGQLGSFARGASQTLTGALSNLENAPTNLLLQLNTANLPGVTAFKDAILALTSAFDVATPAGQAVLRAIEGVVNTVGGMFTAINPGSIAAAFGAISRGFSAVQRFGVAALPIARAFAAGFGPAFMSSITPLRTLFAQLTSGGAPSARTLAMLAVAAQSLGRIFGFVLGTITSVVGSITLVAGVATAAGLALGGLITNVTTRLSTWGTALAAALLGPITSIGTSLYTAFSGVGSQIINGIIAGISAGAGSMITSITGLGTSAIAAIRTALGIHSPSRVFADLVGAQIPAGIAQGVDAHAGLANDAVSGIVSPRVPQLGGAGASVSISIEVNGTGQPQETARAIRTEIEDALGSIFGQYAEAFG